MTLSLIPGGILIFLYSQGTYRTVGIMYGEKYDSLKVPLSLSSKLGHCRDSILYRLVLAHFMAHDDWASWHNITIISRMILHIMCSFSAITRQTHNAFPCLCLVRILVHLLIAGASIHCPASSLVCHISIITIPDYA
jgi:hypothetical protein